MAAGTVTNQINGPNILTAIRILVVPVFGWMLLAHSDSSSWRIATTVLFTLGILTDLVDGWWARRYNLVTDFGKIADPIADKALTGMAFVGLSIIGELHWAITIIILVREWGITLFRFLLLRRGVVLAASRGGKLKTVLQAVAFIGFLWPFAIYNFGDPVLPHLGDLASWFVMVVAAGVTVITGIDYVRDNLSE